MNYPVDVVTSFAHVIGATASSTLFTVPVGETYTILSYQLQRSDDSPHTFLRSNNYSMFAHTTTNLDSVEQVPIKVTGQVDMIASGANVGTHHFASVHYVPYDIAVRSSSFADQSALLSYFPVAYFTTLPSLSEKLLSGLYANTFALNNILRIIYNFIMA